jgi:hypothetical protein
MADSLSSGTTDTLFGRQPLQPITKGRSIRLYLVDGTPTGLITAEIVNWTGHVILAPRSRLADLLQRKEPLRTGVYFLFGPDPNDPAQTLLYIGESENVGKRLTQHNKDNEKSFWERVCIVTSKDQNITKGHGKYLESRLIEIAKRAGRAKITNGTSPEYGWLPEADLADMEFFLEQVKVILPVLGLDFLRDTVFINVTAKPQVANAEAAKVSLESLGLVPPATTARQLTTVRTELGESPVSFPKEMPPTVDQDKPVFEIRDLKSDLVAYAQEIAGEMVVLSGSKARIEEGTSFTTSQKQLRNSLRQKGILADDPNSSNHYIFTADVPFSSPSQASVIILGRSDNGRLSWRTMNGGMTYQKWQEDQISKLPSSTSE